MNPSSTSIQDSSETVSLLQHSRKSHNDSSTTKSKSKNSTESTHKNISVNITLLKRLFRLICVQYGFNPINSGSGVLSGALPMSSVSMSIMATILVWVSSFLKALSNTFLASYVGSWTEHILEEKYQLALYDMLYLVLIWLFSSTCYAVNEGCRAILHYHWRRGLTIYSLEHYFHGKNYYDILKTNDGVEAEKNQDVTTDVPQYSLPHIDNPDQRLQADIDSYCSCAANIFVTGTRQFVAVLVATAVIMYNKMHFSVFIILLGVPIINLIVFRLLMPGITRSIYKMDEHEGYFRYAHARVREYAESMSFFRADTKERQYIEATFEKLLKVIRLISLKYIPLMAYTLGLERAPQVAIFVWLYFAINLSWGPFSPNLPTEDLQNIGTKWFIYLEASTDAFFGIFALADSVTQLTGNTHRIAELWEVCGRLGQISKANAGDVGVDEDKVEVRNLSIITPNNIELVQDVNFTVRPGEDLCIYGQSGCGKSCLLRQLAGLVPCVKGSIRRPNKFGRGGVLFLPQMPYLIRGTLIQQIIYPYMEDVVLHDELDEGDPSSLRSIIIRCMEQVNIGYIAKLYGFERTFDWDKLLSEGEKQRIQIARVLFHRPKFAFLDECSASLDASNQHLCHTALHEAGVTLISVAHVEAVKQYHKQLLYLHNDGTWTLSQLEKSDYSTLDADGWETVGTGDSAHEEKVAEIKQHLDDVAPDPMDDVDIVEGIAARSTGSTGFNWLFVQRFARLLRIILKPTSVWDVLIFVISIVLFGLTSAAIFPIVMLYGQIVAALFAQDPTSFFVLCVVLFATIVSYSLIYGLACCFAILQGVQWRKKLTQYCHSLYFSNLTYYKMIALDKVIQNADQRITSDVNALLNGFIVNDGLPSLELSLVSFLIFCLLAAVSVLLLTHIAAYAIILSFIVAYSVLHIILMIKISRLQFQLDTNEGWFRFQLVRLKEHAEQIALYDGKVREASIIHRYFDKTMFIQGKLLFFSSLLNSYSMALSSGSFLINYITCTSLLYFGLMTLAGDTIEQKAGSIQTIQGLIGLLAGTVTQFMNVGPKAARNMGSLGRVSHFLERCETLKTEYESSLDSQVEQSDKEISCRKLDVRTPKDKLLIKNLSFTLRNGSNLIIMGESGCGKSSILRLLSELWPLPPGSSIRKPSHIGRGGIFFAPQNCYWCLGSLRDNIIYPDRDSSVSDQDLELILEKVNLSHLKHRIGSLRESVHEWRCLLSPGEQQRLAIARILYHSPAFLLADECTASCDLYNENRMYELLKEHGISCISVGHRETIVKHHNMRLSIGSDGSWNLQQKKKMD